MNNFEKIRFKGTFRSYQSRVLDNADEYLKDGRINIVAAPGSGKTVLGLELIRRLNAPCIILSPTTAIRRQWGERFKGMFLENEADFDLLFSEDLHKVKLINSVTYQALYSAVEKIPETDEEETDCSDIDVFALMRERGIRTVCLDEAHHLKNEWQRALEKFISALDKDVRIISLTATPPYDSEGAEWERYLRVCGEIDEEIFVPELVGQKTLCPHQDYVYFNYPTEAETAIFRTHEENVANAMAELKTLPLFSQISERLNGEKDFDKLFSDAKSYIALAVLLRHFGFELNKKLIRQLTAKKGLPDFSLQFAETALTFLTTGEMLTEEQKEEIITVLKKNSVYEKKRVTLEANERMKRTLISSVGKLASIRSIARSELTAMGERMRMLVLTDYIKKEGISKIGTDEAFSSVNVVSIFETLRRELPSVNIGVLSGTLVILPDSVELPDVKYRKTNIPDTGYSAVEFSGAVHNSVSCVGKLFEQGKIQILVGTKSLLGEGWDSPCINSLILASFVGSFVLSNQMRGRAIRTDKNDPEKSSNIWHLVTVTPEYILKDNAVAKAIVYAHWDENQIDSYDYKVLKRRFDSFMAPNYTTGRVESGIERITAIKPPFNKKGIDNINAEMLRLSAIRADTLDKWKGEVAEGGFSVGVETRAPKEARVPIFTFWNFALSSAILIAEYALIQLWSAFARESAVTSAGIFIAMAMLAFLLFKIIVKAMIHFTPARSIKVLGTAVYKTLKEAELISASASLEALEEKDVYFVCLYLRNASLHDQNVFNTAMTEMLTPIENPRYVLIAKNIFGGYDYRRSFACPSVIAKKKEYAELLAEKLKLTTGKFEPVYTYRENGRELILKCRKRSYITANEKAFGKNYKVSHWE